MKLPLLFTSVLFAGVAIAQTPATPTAQTPQAAQTQAPVTAAPATDKAPAADDLPDTPSTTAQILVSPEPTGPTALIDTSMGRLNCKLFGKETPITVANFIELVEGTKEFTDPKTGKKMKGVPFYDGTTFHRVIPHFMIQGGDRMGDGSGDAGYMFEDEILRSLRFDRPGRLAMANSGPGTNGSQFFITEEPTEHLNGRHTIFGQCDAHTVLLVQAIARVPVGANDKPVTPVVINHITIVREGQPIPPEPALPAAQPAAQQ